MNTYQFSMTWAWIAGQPVRLRRAQVLPLRIPAIRGLYGLALATLSLRPGFAQSNDPKWKIDISGYADLYYQFDFGRPPVNGGVNGRWYDINHDAYRLAALQLDLLHAPTDRSPFGFFVSLYGGKNADILATTEPGGINTYKDFMQAYVTYRFAGKAPTTIDFGKWYAFIGYEALDSRNNDNYSRSFLFTSLEPDYMTGFRVTTILNPRLTANAYLYQGYNEVQDSNHGKTLGLATTYAFNPKLSATLQGYKGQEGSNIANQSGSFGGIGYPTAGVSDTTQVCLSMTYQPNSRDKFAFDGDYASAKGMGNWNGAEVVYRCQLSTNAAAAVRLEHADDTDGLRFLAGPVLLHSLTETYDYTVSRNVLLRFEFRQDFASKDFVQLVLGFQEAPGDLDLCANREVLISPSRKKRSPFPFP